jgi:alcohol dehydrogenase class IV
MSLRNLWYRVFQAIFGLGARMLPWRKAVVISGAGAIAEIPGLLHNEHRRRVMVVTDPGLMKARVAQRLTAVLEAAGMPYLLYSEVEANPSVNTVDAIAAAYQKAGCDSFVAIGGGSAMDAAKAAAALIVRPDKSLAQLGGLLRVRRRIPPFIAVPTTAGTGSETTIAALVTDTQSHHKYAIMDLNLIPHYAVLDPELTLGLPPQITAATGMDALTHAVEAYLCWTYNTAESRRFAREATRAIFANLRQAYTDGSDMKARLAMQLASYRAGFAFTRAGVGNVHAIAHTLGGLYNTPHGLANAVLLPVVLEDYDAAVQGKLAELAAVAGVADAAADDATNAQNFIAAIRALNETFAMPAGLSDIRDEDVEQMITWALAEANPLYPVPVIYDRARCRAVIEKVRLRQQ